MALPEAREDFPWGHSAYKVGKKIFLVMSLEDGLLKASVKLPLSGAFALMQPWAQPTGYGLGKSGWVSASFRKPADVPVDLLRQWIVESYRAIAPKKLSALLRA
jgi:predicted DNA-binding protein (MmcQ/YjbR family)